MKSVRAGIMLLTLLTIAFPAIADTKRTGPRYGYFFAGRLWDKPFLDDPAVPIGGQVTLLSPAAKPALRLYKASTNGALAQFIVFTLLSLGLFFACLLRWVSLPLRTLSRGMHRRDPAILAGLRERRRAQKAQKVSEERLFLALTAAGMGTWDMELATGNVTISRDYELLLGCRPGTFGGTLAAFLEQIHPDDRDAFLAATTRAKEEQTGLDVEYRVVRPDGSLHWLVSKGCFFYDPAGRAIRSSGATIDITARKQAEDELCRARDAAEMATRTKSRFLADMSHELRTPLNAIIGFSEMLCDQTFGPLNPKQARYTTNIHTSGRHLLQLINDILDLSKVEAGRMELEYAVVDAAALLQGVQGIVRTLAAKKQVALILQVQEDLPKLMGDEAKIKQIAYNLLSNAVKFTPEGGTVTITASLHPESSADPVSKECIRIDVSDTGIGIQPGDQKRIFSEFHQVDSSYARQQQGTGLGLTLTRRLVEMHSGRMWVESAGIAGRGSTFTVLLPLKAQEATVEVSLGTHSAEGGETADSPHDLFGREQEQKSDRHQDTRH